MWCSPSAIRVRTISEVTSAPTGRPARERDRQENARRDGPGSCGSPRHLVILALLERRRQTCGFGRRRSGSQPDGVPRGQAESLTYGKKPPPTTLAKTLHYGRRGPLVRPAGSREIPDPRTMERDQVIPSRDGASRCGTAPCLWRNLGQGSNVVVTYPNDRNCRSGPSPGEKSRSVSHRVYFRVGAGRPRPSPPPRHHLK
jgi:hypothetical protein